MNNIHAKGFRNQARGLPVADAQLFMDADLVCLVPVVPPGGRAPLPYPNYPLVRDTLLFTCGERKQLKQSVLLYYYTDGGYRLTLHEPHTYHGGPQKAAYVVIFEALPSGATPVALREKVVRDALDDSLLLFHRNLDVKWLTKEVATRVADLVVEPLLAHSFFKLR